MRMTAWLSQVGVPGWRAAALALALIVLACGPTAGPPPPPNAGGSPPSQSNAAGSPSGGGVPAGAPAAGSGAGAAAPASGGAVSPALQTLIDGARQEGQLDLVWSQSTLDGTGGARKLQEAIKKKDGLNLRFNFTPGPAGPAIGARIVQEVAAGQPSYTDVQAISVYPDITDAFTPVDWRQYAPELPDDAILYGGRGVAWGTLVPGITYNTQLVTGDRVPRSLEDFLKPEWKGKVAAPPYVVGRAIYATPEYLGYDRWFELWGQYTRQVGGLMRCGESDRVLSGEFQAFAIDCGDYEARAAQRAGRPLGHVIPAEGAPLRFWVTGVPRTAAHPNAAKLFILYLTSRAGQDFVWETDATDAYPIPGSKIAAVVKTYQDRGVKFYTEDSLLQKYPQLLDYEKDMLGILQQAQ
jgi:ABC-type Fe3+ transport system substrate-binding protein